MMESARLKADIVSGLGADSDEEEVPTQKKVDHEAEPTRKYAVMKSTKETEAAKNKESDGFGLFDKSVITADGNNNALAKGDPMRKFQGDNLEDISQIQGADATVAFMDGKEGMELFGNVGASADRAEPRAKSSGQK